MAVNSQMLELGTALPEAKLPDVHDATVRALHDFPGPALVVAFICKHCPYVQHVKEGLKALGRDLAARDVPVVGIVSNDWDAYPDDTPESMAAEGYPFPVLADETQEVARAFSAACTPDFFVFDGDRRLVYRGQMDDARPGNDVPVTAADLVTAVDAVLDGVPVPAEQKPSVGCSIKWRPGNEPNYSV